MKGGEVMRPFVAHRVTELQSDRVTEWQSHTTSTPYTGEWIFFMPIFNKLPYSLLSQGDNSAAFHPFGPKFFLRPFGQKSMSQKKIFLGRGPVGPGPGAKKTVICQAISAIWQDTGLKFETKA